MTRLHALLIAIVLWAGVFLPGLGSSELKGEEPRRVMPAVTMAQGGDWVVPYVGGEPFLRKPPLVQWCIAISLKVFGQNAWAARLPSVLSVLALAVTIILGTRGWLRPREALLAAIVTITQAAIVDKGRLAELEAIYFSLSGITIVLWMSWWAQGRSPWLVWVVPFFVHGLALLAKAPLHLLFFYAIVAGAHISSGEWSRIWQWRTSTTWRILSGWLLVVIGIWWWFFKRNPEVLHLYSLVPILAGAILLPARSRPHFAGVALMVLMFAAWAEPYYHRVDPAQLAATLQHQAVDRFFGPDASLKNWLANVPSGIGDHAPWILFAPLLWRRRAGATLRGRSLALFRSGRWAVAICFFALLLVPGVLPRYVLPLTAPFSVLLAQELAHCPRWVRRWWRRTLVVLTGLMLAAALASPFIIVKAIARGAQAISPIIAIILLFAILSGTLVFIVRRRRLRDSLRLPLWTGALAVMGLTLYATCVVPWVGLRENIRPFARGIDTSLPKDVPLVAYDLGDFPPLLAVLFYLQTPFAYAPSEENAPPGVSYFLVREEDRPKFEKKFEPLGTCMELGGHDEKHIGVVIKAIRRKESFR